MPTSPDDARNLANAFREAANRLSEFIHDEWDNLTPIQKQKLDSAEWDLRTDAFNFRTMAVGINLDNIEQGLTTLTLATTEANAVIAQINKAGNIIKVAASIVMLGGAIISQNPMAIVDASIELLKVVRSIPIP